MVTRILITGSREFDDEDYLFEVLSEVYERLDDPETIVVHGGATGADSLAGKWARMMQEDFRVFEEVHPADWSLGRAAGPIRNKEMVAEGATIVIAFFKSGAGNIGTQNCVDAARAAGLTVEEYRA